VAYAKALHALVRWIGICDGNMQEGSFRCDANVSVRRAGEAKLGTRCEIKNLNSFRFMEQAIEFEARRQIELIEDGGAIVQETRLYDPDRNETRSMRSKEDAQDYRYFPDPDLLPLVISEGQIEAIKAAMPQLPVAKREKYRRELGLSAYDAGLLTESREKAEFFDLVLGLLKNPSAKTVANWINGEYSALLNHLGRDFPELPVPGTDFAGLLDRVIDGTISKKAANDVLQAMAKGEGSADAIIERRGLKQESDAGAIEKIVDEVMAAGAKLVEDYRAGKEKAFNALVGQVMKASKGKANPAQVNEILRRKLKG
jgi:aspartyl-tRNA(Asn)/glutamyl-tRNA(Gln) amidotransferase subunit B